MNVEQLSMIGPAVDLQTVNSIHKKRLLAFINHFVINTASFLNKLSQSCEQRFLQLESRIMKLEAAMIILESKLSSVPGLKEVPVEVAPSAVVHVEVKTPLIDLEPPPIVPNQEVLTEAPAKTEELDANLMRFVKMLQFGVPPPAVRSKLEQEGVDSSLHDSIFNYGK